MDKLGMNSGGRFCQLRFLSAKDAETARQKLEDFDDGPWGQKYPAIAQSWRRAWSEVIPFFAFPGAVRRIICTTNAIESLNAKLRRAVKTRGHFPNDDAATISSCSRVNG